MASYLMVMDEIHVLLVDHDSEGLVHTATLLQMCQYKVTLVERASIAIAMLLSRETKFDVVMANINSPDLRGLKLLEHAVTMDIPIIFDDDTLMTMRAIQNGTLLCIKKPTTMEMLRYLWQHVVREKMQKIRKNDALVSPNYRVPSVQFREEIYHTEGIWYNIGCSNRLMTDGKGEFTQQIMQKSYMNLEGDNKLENHMIVNNENKRKVRTEWTQELHDKFMDAIEQLGEGRCFPKDILEFMNVPGLTRTQVASHLQKCRNNNWRSPRDTNSKIGTKTISLDVDGSQHKQRRFGSVPRLGKDSSYNESPQRCMNKKCDSSSHTSNIGGDDSKTNGE